jgi:hypothetical protein
MRFLVRALLILIVLGVIGAGVGWYLAGREPGPTIEIVSPERFIGQTGTLEFTVDAPDGVLGDISAALEQNGQSTALNPPGTGSASESRPHRISMPIGKQAQPALVAGQARLVITASRPVFFGLRTATTTVTRDLTVRLEPPRIAVVSLHHFINLGGAEFVVLRATPEDVEAGIRVGDADYPAFPASSVGLTDPALRVAFFALRYDQPISTTITAFARDPGGNQATTPVEHKPFNKVFVRSRIPIDQPFLDKVVPAIAANTSGLTVDTGSPDGLLAGFLAINGDLRQKNAAAIAALAGQTRPQMLWKDAFQQLGNTQVESRFADQRTYFFAGKEIDRQVHLGFDLASVQHAPVLASNAGRVMFADFLGIYGNCVIIDHGLGVQSLYAHLSQIAVKPGADVTKGEEIGRTGSTGLAGGDHLHFTMLVHGTPVNPVEWWDQHWIDDRVLRKIREAGGPQ